MNLKNQEQYDESQVFIADIHRVPLYEPDIVYSGEAPQASPSSSQERKAVASRTRQEDERRQERQRLCTRAPLVTVYRTT